MAEQGLMGEQGLDGARRALLRAAIGAASAGLLCPLAPSAAADKLTKAQAAYQDTPNGIYSCATCTLFEAPHRCKVVDGEVSSDGWCKAFAMAD